MIHEPEFVRGNQKSYVRIECSKNIFEGYEYQMCRHNVLGSFLVFQQRNQNGEHYLYYEVSGMQSLDVFLQTQKLKRAFMIILAKEIIRLCKELSEYALDIANVVFMPKYVMVNGSGREVRFLYSFCKSGVEYEGVEKLLECCIEYLDYKDEELMQLLYKIYEDLLEQGEHFSLGSEMEELLNELSEKEEEEPMYEDLNFIPVSNPFERVSEEVVISMPDKSEVARKEKRNLKAGLKLMFVLNIAVICLWKPLTILKIFFCTAIGIVLFILNIHIYLQEKKNKKDKDVQKEAEQYIEKYEENRQKFGLNNDGTQIITIKDSEKFLYNMQGIKPEYIYFSDTKKIIGKDSEHVQICVPYEGVSRIHALIIREGSEYKVEDLNSTNGTWVNGKALVPRTPCVLKEGDKVRFAEIEYIFR